MIKVGEYVRTKTGYIGIVENINDFRPPEAKICVDFNVPDLIFLGETDITKHSKNIIDLIEEGDYVNGCRVSDLGDGLHLEFDYGVSFVDVGLSTYTDGHIEGIKTILTKEQYEANCYKVKEEIC